MPQYDNPRQARLADFISACRKKGWRIQSLTLLAGDASNRTYYRLHRQGQASLVLALYPEPFDEASSPFLDACRLFSSLGIRTPKVIEVASELGIVLQEDLGDRLLQDVVEECEEQEKEAWYEVAVDLIARIQSEGETVDKEDFGAFALAFDEEKLLQELLFFEEHFLAGLMGCTLEPSQSESLRRSFRDLARLVSRRPRVLCHRDFHSRNLIVTDSEMAVIDFQDARLGPRSYDAVSLLLDSYVRHSESFVVRMRTRLEVALGESLEQEWDATALQRNLKALGTFGFQIARRDNDVYRRYIRPTLGLVDANLRRHDEWSTMSDILREHIDELPQV